jgi:hypothetical protein
MRGVLVLLVLASIPLAQACAQTSSDAYDWGEGAYQKQMGQGATSSDSYDWGQSAVDRSYYGKAQAAGQSGKPHALIGDASDESKPADDSSQLDEIAPPIFRQAKHSAVGGGK